MRNYFKFGMFALAMSLYSCGGSGDTAADDSVPANPNNPNNPNSTASVSDADSDPVEEVIPPSQRVDLSTKGVGPIKSVDFDLNSEINQELADKGQKIYETNCTACHHPHKQLVGPPQEGVFERRTPEWVMNMIMDPEGMVQNDPLAKELLMEFNGSPMSNQGIDEAGARALLEYFRTL